MTVLSAPRVEPVWAAEGWEVRTVTTPTGFVETHLQDDGLALLLGDLDGPHPHRSGRGDSTSAWFGSGGRASIACLSAPPVLWLGAHGHRLAPQDPWRREQLRVAPGDLLVICSADVLEHLDHGLPHLAALTDGLGDPTARAGALADDLRAASPAGAAAVAVWSPVPAPVSLTTDRTDAEEARP